MFYVSCITFMSPVIKYVLLHVKMPVLLLTPSCEESGTKNQ